MESWQSRRINCIHLFQALLDVRPHLEGRQIVYLKLIQRNDPGPPEVLELLLYRWLLLALIVFAILLLAV